LAERGGETTKLDWVVDSDFRFFPTVRDEGRREPRDVVDLLTVHERILPLGAAVWASVGKTLGFTPEGVINEIRRTARYTDADFRRVASDPPLIPPKR
jgi:hypothetical protein